MIVEACVETLQEALNAQAGGAHRVELCAELDADGVTPSDALLRACVRAVALPVFAMIRPRAGSFVFTGEEAEVMLRQARQVRRLGARGLVTGALDAHGRIDAPVVAALVREAGDLPVTFHRAFDAVADRSAALEELIALGVSRVLTSGGAATAAAGAEAIARLVRQAGTRIVVVAGGGVRARNVRALVRRTGVREVHGRFGVASSVRAVVDALATGGPSASG